MPSRQAITPPVPGPSSGVCARPGSGGFSHHDYCGMSCRSPREAAERGLAVLATGESGIPAVWLELRNGARAMIPLSGQVDVLLVMGSSREIRPTNRREEAQRETLAAACWLMPSLSPALIAEALELGADQSSPAVDPAGALSAGAQ